MKVYGLDFTSAPRPRKPITCAEGRLVGRSLHVEALVMLDSFDRFETFLGHSGPWLAGMDFPFGQPRKLIINLKWPRSWAGYVRQVAALGKLGFEGLLADYRRPRPFGDKQHRRAVDVKAKSQSPMTLSGVPVGKMFFQGAPRLLKAGVSVLPCHRKDDNRIVVEAYPALVARAMAGSRDLHYKNDTRAKQTPEHRKNRRRILAGICSEKLISEYGLTLDLGADVAGRCLADPSGDCLDAVLCAIQAAWAYRQPHKGYGIPAECDRLEGWIVDPELLDA